MFPRYGQGTIPSDDAHRHHAGDAGAAPASAGAGREQFFASTRADLCKRNVLDMLCGAERSLLETISGSLEGNRFVLIQALCRRADETMFPAEISVSRLPLGGKMHLSFFIRDITLRKEQEERLKTGYNALQNSGSGIAVADVEFSLAGYVNPSMLALLGLETVDEAYACNFRQFLKDEALAADMIEAVKAGDTWTGELEMKRQDGAPFFAQASLEPNLNPDGAMTGARKTRRWKRICGWRATCSTPFCRRPILTWRWTIRESPAGWSSRTFTIRAGWWAAISSTSWRFPRARCWSSWPT